MTLWKIQAITSCGKPLDVRLTDLFTTYRAASDWLWANGYREDGEHKRYHKNFVRHTLVNGNTREYKTEFVRVIKVS